MYREQKGKGTTLDKIKSLWPDVFKWAVVAAVSGSLTYGYTQGSCTEKTRIDVAAMHEELRVIGNDLKSSMGRIGLIESTGSTALQRHADKEDERVKQLEQRLSDTRTDFGQRIQNITGLLEKMVSQQTELIAYLKAEKSK